MFNPSSKIKKILGTYGNCAYIHRDGVVVLERKEVKIDKDNYTKVDVYHIIPCEIKIRTKDYKYLYDYTTDMPEERRYPTVNRLVIHDASLIANGFDSVKISFNNNSLSSKELGLVINVIHFQKGDHKWECVNINGLMGSDVAIQPDVTQPYAYDGESTIRAYLDYQYRSGNSVVLHGELPEIKTEILQLTVNS